jgi:hypothetical protein
LDLGLGEPEPRVATPATPITDELADFQRQARELERIKIAPIVDEPKITPWQPPYNPWITNPYKTVPYPEPQIVPWISPGITAPNKLPWIYEPYVGDPVPGQAPYVGDVPWTYKTYTTNTTD